MSDHAFDQRFYRRLGYADGFLTGCVVGSTIVFVGGLIGLAVMLKLIIG